MSSYLEKAADWIAHSVYPAGSDDAKGMKLALIKVFNVLLLSMGVIASTYAMSTTLSVISLLFTGASSLFLYMCIRKTYITMRTDKGDVSPDKAKEEFSRIIGIVSSNGIQYVTTTIKHLKQ